MIGMRDGLLTIPDIMEARPFGIVYYDSLTKMCNVIY